MIDFFLGGGITCEGLPLRIVLKFRTDCWLGLSRGGAIASDLFWGWNSELIRAWSGAACE